MAGVASITRNLEAEDEAVRRDMEAHHKEMFGDGTDSPASEPSEDAMRIMSAGPVTINYPQPKEPSPTAAPAAGIGTKALIAAVLGTSGLTGALATGIPWALGAFDKPAATDTDTDTQYQLELVPETTE